MSKVVINEYICGLLYGDGGYHNHKGREQYAFSTTNKQLADKVKKEFDKLGLEYSQSIRENKRKENKNYELLEIISTTDQTTLKILRRNNIIGASVKDRIRNNDSFLRGYLETKGTLFEHKTRGGVAWRIAFSGNQEDMNYLKRVLESDLKIRTSNVLQRQERVEQGIISESYRLPIQNRAGVTKIIQYLNSNNDNNISGYLKNRIENFKKYNTNTPFNRKVQVFKHYKSAVQYMARELGMTFNGKKNDIRPNGWRLVYGYDQEGNNIVIFNGYEVAYKWVVELYQSKTNFTPPKVFVEK